MKKFIAGTILGLMLGSGISWAAYTHLTLVDRNGNELGTTSNPLYATAV